MLCRLAPATAVLVLLAAAAPPALPPASSNARAADAGTTQVVQFDKEKVICRSDKAIGSRVTSKRVCMTAQQWETQRMEDRRGVERGQAQRTLSGD